MKQIQLTKGCVTSVDDDIFEVIGNLKWHAHHNGKTTYAIRNYVVSPGKRRRIPLHHVVMGYPLNKFEVDHIDGNGLNNQRINLRIVSHRDNCLNKDTHREGNGRSKYPGVYKAMSKGKWFSQIHIPGNPRKYLGVFPTELEAHQAYMKAKAALAEFGEGK